MVGVVLPEPARAGGGVVGDEGAALATAEVVARTVQHVAGEEDAAAAREGHSDFTTLSCLVHFDIDLALRRVDRGVVRVDRLVLAAGNNVEAAVLQVGGVEGDPDREEGGRAALKVVRQLGRLLRVPSRPYDQRWYN
jgi:hypothetical protein